MLKSGMYSWFSTSWACTKENVMKLTAYRSRHSETCFGARLEIGEGNSDDAEEIVAEKLRRS